MKRQIPILAAMVLAILPLAGSRAWAGWVGAGSWVPLPGRDVTISGPGVSIEEVMNSLTDTHGLLEDIRLKNSGRVTIDGRPTIQGNWISIPASYHEFGAHRLDESGTLSVAPFNHCGPGARGRRLVLQGDPAKNSNDAIRVTQTLFEVCARASGANVYVHVSPYLIAGPQWSNKAVEVANVLYADMKNTLRRHALSYASESHSAGVNATDVASRSSSDVPK